MSLLAAPLNVRLLTSLHEEERSLADLSQAAGLPPASTLRAYLRTLADWGVLERKQAAGFPGAVSYELTDAGDDLIRSADVLQRWLKAGPNGPIALGSPAAKSAVKALVDGWDTAVVRALAARPCTLTELARAIPQVSYPTLERRLTAMRRVGLAEPRRSGDGRGTPYGATAWLGEAVAPLIAAAAWERRHAPTRTNPIGRLDVEAVFLLVLPSLRLATELSGSCRLAVQLRSGSELRHVGTTVTLEQGRTISATARLDRSADAWATGTARGWYRWIGRGDEDEVDVGGDATLAFAVAEGFRKALVPAEAVDRPVAASRSTARN
ncbi:MAG: winged helix-turn-helix transcriptional regulator [Solirubrobacterales bacterium]